MMLSRPSNDASSEEGGTVANLLRCFPAGRREVLWQIYWSCDKDNNVDGSCDDDDGRRRVINLDLGLGKFQKELSELSTKSLIHRKARFFAI
jgi:hypothetical protein